MDSAGGSRRQHRRPIVPLLFLSMLIGVTNSSAPPPENLASIISRFQQYLQINTAHPNPDYNRSTDFLLSQAKSISLESQTLEFVSGKPIVLLKWPGSNPNLPSILLNSHTDVVPAEHSKWTYHPFSGHIDEQGNIYGRGSQDMKCVGMQYLEAIRKLKLSGFTPDRSVYLSFVPDEEIADETGAEKLAESDIFKNMNVGIVLDEGAKLYDYTALEKLFESIERIRRFRASQFELVKAGLKAEGEVISVNMAFLKAGTPSPTGFVMNMQPSEAEAGFDIRIPPTADHVALERRITEEWAPASRNMTFEFKQKMSMIDNSGRPLLTAPDNSNPWWTLLEEAIKKASGTTGKPEIFPATTDAYYFRLLGFPAFGFSPMANTPILLHDHNEFLNQAEYMKGIDMYESIIKAYASYIPQGNVDVSKDEL